MRVTYVNVRARHLLKKSMVRAPKNMAAIVIAIVMNLPGMTLQPLYTRNEFKMLQHKMREKKTFIILGYTLHMFRNDSGTQAC